MPQTYATDLLAAVEQTSAAIARLDQALDRHPLLPAFLYRARLEAVRRQAAVDGHSIDPWHLAATLEGLRLRMDHELRIVDRGQIIEAGRIALSLHQWLTEPNANQVDEVHAAERHLAGSVGLAGTAEAVWRWLEQGKARAPLRAGLVAHWVRTGRSGAPVPLTGPRALAADAPGDAAEWVITFLDALGEEAETTLDLLVTLERGWLAARRLVPSQRRTSRATLAVDVMAATPLISATTLAQAIGMSIKGATVLLDRLAAAGIAVEVTHRAARRLFGLAGMVPVREVSAPPRRPMPGRGRGRPRLEAETVSAEPIPPAVFTSMSRFERPPLDYSALDDAMAYLKKMLRQVHSQF